MKPGSASGSLKKPGPPQQTSGASSGARRTSQSGKAPVPQPSTPPSEGTQPASRRTSSGQPQNFSARPPSSSNTARKNSLSSVLGDAPSSSSPVVVPTPKNAPAESLSALTKENTFHDVLLAANHTILHGAREISKGGGGGMQAWSSALNRILLSKPVSIRESLIVLAKPTPTEHPAENPLFVVDGEETKSENSIHLRIAQSSQQQCLRGSTSLSSITLPSGTDRKLCSTLCIGGQTVEGQFDQRSTALTVRQDHIAEAPPPEPQLAGSFSFALEDVGQTTKDSSTIKKQQVLRMAVANLTSTMPTGDISARLSTPSAIVEPNQRGTKIELGVSRGGAATPLLAFSAVLVPFDGMMGDNNKVVNPETVQFVKQNKNATGKHCSVVEIVRHHSTSSTGRVGGGGDSPPSPIMTLTHHDAYSINSFQTTVQGMSPTPPQHDEASAVQMKFGDFGEYQGGSLLNTIPKSELSASSCTAPNFSQRFLPEVTAFEGQGKLLWKMSGPRRSSTPIQCSYNGAWKMGLRCAPCGELVIAQGETNDPSLPHVRFEGKWSGDARHGDDGKLTVVYREADKNSADQDGGSIMSQRPLQMLELNCDFSYGTVQGKGRVFLKDLNPQQQPEQQPLKGAKATSKNSPQRTQTGGPLISFEGITSGSFHGANALITFHFPVGSFTGSFSAADHLVKFLRSKPRSEQFLFDVGEFADFLSEVRTNVHHPFLKCVSSIRAATCLANSSWQLHGESLLLRLHLLQQLCDLATQNVGLFIETQSVKANSVALEEFRRQVKSLAKQLERVLADVSKKGKDITALKSDISDKVKQIATAEGQLEAEKKKMNDLFPSSSLGPLGLEASQQTQELRTRLETLSSEKSALEQEVKDGTTRVLGLKQDCRALQNKKEQTEKDNKVALSEKVKLESHLAQVLEKLTSLEQKDTNGVPKDPAEEKLESAVKDARLSLQTLNDTLATLSSEVASQVAQLSLLRKPPPDHAASISSEDLGSEVTLLKADVLELQKSLEANASTKNSLEKSLESCVRSESSASAARTIDELKLKGDTLRQQLKTRNSEINRKRSKETVLRGRLDDTQNSMEAQKESAKSQAVKSFASLEAEKTEKENQLRRFREEASELISSIEGAKKLKRTSPPPLATPLTVVAAATSRPSPVGPTADEVLSIKELTKNLELLTKKKLNVSRKNKDLSNKLKELSLRKEAVENAMRRSSQVREAAAKENVPSLEFSSFDGTAEELKVLLAKVRSEAEANERTTAARRLHLERLTLQISELKTANEDKRASARQVANNPELRLKALQEEVDLLDGQIAKLRADTKRIHIVEAKIASQREVAASLSQSAEVRQQHALTKARAEMEWQNTAAFTRKHSITMRPAGAL